MIGFLNHTTCVRECPANYTSKLDCKVNSMVKSCEQFGDIKDLDLLALASGKAEFPAALNVFIYPSKGGKNHSYLLLTFFK